MSKHPEKNKRQIRSTAEFARFVGLARTTVSRVLNGQPGLRSKTIERVQRAIEETGFTPNAYAAHLRGKRTAVVGICMENLLTPPAVRKLAFLQAQLREREFSSLIEVVAPGDSQKVLRHFLSLRVEAVIFIGHFDEAELSARIGELLKNGTPHLVIDHVGIKKANTVALDRVRGMTEVTNYLLDLGHTRFGLLGISGPVRSNFDRLRGIEAALVARKLSLDACVRSLDHQHVRGNDFDYGRHLAQSFADLRHAMPTAFVCLNDEIAIGALHEFVRMGFSVPGDVSVVGFNNQDICRMTTPTLTSVDQQIDETVRIAAEVLLGRIEASAQVRPVLRMVRPELIVRQSSGPVGARARS